VKNKTNLKHSNITVNRHQEDSFVLLVSSSVSLCCQELCFRLLCHQR